MTITFNLELDSKQNKKGENLIMIRASQGHKHKRINCEIHLSKKHWDNKRKQVKKTMKSIEKVLSR